MKLGTLVDIAEGGHHNGLWTEFLHRRYLDMDGLLCLCDISVTHPYALHACLARKVAPGAANGRRSISDSMGSYSRFPFS